MEYLKIFRPAIPLNVQKLLPNIKPDISRVLLRINNKFKTYCIIVW